MLRLTIISIFLFVKLFQCQQYWIQRGDYNIAVFGYLRLWDKKEMQCQPKLRISPFVLTELIRNLTITSNIYLKQKYNKSIGFIYFDSCLSIKRSIEFLMKYLTYQNDPNPNGKIPIVGAVSLLSPSNTRILSYILKNWNVTIINVNSAHKSNMKPRNNQMVLNVGLQYDQIINGFIDTIKHFGWKYVGIFYNNDPNTLKFKGQLIEKLIQQNICIGPLISVTKFQRKHLEYMIKNSSNTHLRIIISLLHYDNTKKMIRLLKKNKTNDKIVISTVSNKCENCIKLNLYAKGSSFEDYFTKLTFKQLTHNPWYKIYLKRIFKCKNNCEKYLNVQLFRSKSIYVTKFLFNVELSFTTLEMAIKRSLENDEINEGLSKSIVNISFTIPTQRSKYFNVSFDENGNLNSYMIIDQYRNENSLQIGEYKLKKQSTDFFANSKSWNITESYCSKECGLGEIKKVISRLRPCCWACVKCPPNAIVSSNNSVCIDCPELQWPNSSSGYRTCRPLRLSSFLDHYNLVIINGILSVLGLVTTIAILVTFIVLRHNKFIKATSLSLSVFMLYTLLLIYIQLYLFNFELTDTLCKVRQIGLPLLYTCLYSALFVKSIRILLIFRASEQFQRPKFVGSTSVVLMVGALVLGQLLLTIALLMAHEPPRVQVWVPSRFDPTASIDCHADAACFFLPCGYITLIIAATTICAIRARRLPDQFRETLSILPASCGTLVLWLGFFPLYAAIPPVWYRTFTELALFQISTFLFMGLLFITKLVNIYFEYQKNKLKPRSLSVQSKTCTDTFTNEFS